VWIELLAEKPRSPIREEDLLRFVTCGPVVQVLAASLENQLRRTVVDKTGLAGAWDFQGAWEIEPGPDSAAPSIFTGVREQLGLRLVPQKGPVNTLVIDQAERPSEN
jgi:uncharacterized protein (TIGR03435 family)